MSNYFSIITINFNNKIGLKNTIESVINQIETKFEFIIIDGGSTDGSVELISKYKNNIDYWVSESDFGIYDAMNKGINIATGKYLFFLNSGDLFYDNQVLKNVIEYTINDWDLLAGNVNLISKSKQLDKIWYTKNNYTFSEIAFGHIPHQGFFFKAELFIKHGLYNINNKIVSDWEFILKLIYNNVSIIYTKTNFASHFLDGISHNTDFEKIQINERNNVLKKYKSIYDDLKMINNSKDFFKFFKYKLINSIRFRIKFKKK